MGVIRFQLFLWHIGRKEGFASELWGSYNRVETESEVSLQEAQGMPPCNAEGEAQHAAGRDRGKQDSGRCLVGFEVFLDDQSTHGVADYRRRVFHLPGYLCEIGNIVGDAHPAQAFSLSALAMPAQV